MKKLLLLIALLGQARWGAAQSAPQPTAPLPPRSAFSAGKQDTLRALGTMYDRRRRVGRFWLGIAAVGGLTTARFAANPAALSPNPNAKPTAGSYAGVAISGGVFFILPLVIGIGKLAGTSETTRDRVINDYREGGKLPWGVALKLKEKDF